MTGGGLPGPSMGGTGIMGPEGAPQQGSQGGKPPMMAGGSPNNDLVMSQVMSHIGKSVTSPGAPPDKPQMPSMNGVK